MLHLNHKLNEWCVKFLVTYKGVPHRIMYRCMPLRIKFWYLLYRSQCFYEHKILAIMPLSWRIKRLGKWLNKVCPEPKQVGKYFKITKRQRLKWKLSGWWFRKFHRKELDQLCQRISKDIEKDLLNQMEATV